MSGFDSDGVHYEIAEDPKASISSLGEKIRKGEALIVWHSEMSRKEERELKKDALEFIKRLKRDPLVHFVFMGGCMFQVIE